MERRARRGEVLHVLEADEQPRPGVVSSDAGVPDLLDVGLVEDVPLDEVDATHAVVIGN